MSVKLFDLKQEHKQHLDKAKSYVPARFLET